MYNKTYKNSLDFWNQDLVTPEYIYIKIYIHVYMCVYVCVYMHIYTCISMCIYIYIFLMYMYSGVTRSWFTNLEYLFLYVLSYIYIKWSKQNTYT